MVPSTRLSSPPWARISSRAVAMKSFGNSLRQDAARSVSRVCFIESIPKPRCLSCRESQEEQIDAVTEVFVTFTIFRELEQ